MAAQKYVNNQLPVHDCQVREGSLVLKGHQQVRCRLCVIPWKPGVLSINAIEWTLNGCALGRLPLLVPHPAPRKQGLNKYAQAHCVMTDLHEIASGAAYLLGEQACSFFGVH